MDSHWHVLMSVEGPQNAHDKREVQGVLLDGPEPLNLRLSHIEIQCQGTDEFVQSAHFVKVRFLGGGNGFQPFGFFRRQAAFLLRRVLTKVIQSGLAGLQFCPKSLELLIRIVGDCIKI